ncbi:MAG TPA: hypothetical protein PK238_07725, partial [Giesbergeria sp.]|nr:hypothetical protein [Giesbergeria sp.]
RRGRIDLRFTHHHGDAGAALNRKFEQNWLLALVNKALNAIVLEALLVQILEKSAYCWVEPRKHGET